MGGRRSERGADSAHAEGADAADTLLLYRPATVG